MVRLAEPVTGIEPMPINASSSPPFGTPGTIVGFGASWDEESDFGLKRVGSVVTSDCTVEADLVCWSFEEPLGPPGTDASLCYGDSGGPMFVDVGSGPVVSPVNENAIDSVFCAPPHISTAADVFVLRDFVEAAAGEDLGTSCGPFAPASELGTPVQGFHGMVDAGAPQARHVVEVDPNATLLRIALNATDGEGARDFDLYVKAGAPPTSTDHDCALDDASQYGACEFTGLPQTDLGGEWHVLVQQVLGFGEYQVTATVFHAACGDGIDNDDDGSTDLDDPECAAPWNNSEAPICGLGSELAAIPVGITWVLRRRRQG